ncbi:uncharacterized protein LOC120768712 [Bactrocera tryoni]|uniref:uncharacterized protein LOC120768712 n=1 Tax=Bactrocera tryoni TaxID=59916 RepID=UPI001A960815|nr:uncharacterized protein LOC120768712 [Bactrocera tryoni]
MDTQMNNQHMRAKTERTTQEQLQHYRPKSVGSQVEGVINALETPVAIASAQTEDPCASDWWRPSDKWNDSIRGASHNNIWGSSGGWIAGCCDFGSSGFAVVYKYTSSSFLTSSRIACSSANTNSRIACSSIFTSSHIACSSFSYFINKFFLAITSFFFFTITSIFFLISSHIIFPYAIVFLYPSRKIDCSEDAWNSAKKMEDREKREEEAIALQRKIVEQNVQMAGVLAQMTQALTSLSEVMAKLSQKLDK